MKKKRIKPWKIVKQNIHQEMDDKMDKAMRDIIFQYTRGDEERKEARHDPMDYTGTGFLKKKYKVGPFAEDGRQLGFFEQGILNA